MAVRAIVPTQAMPIQGINLFTRGSFLVGDATEEMLDDVVGALAGEGFAVVAGRADGSGVVARSGPGEMAGAVEEGLGRIESELGLGGLVIDELPQVVGSLDGAGHD